VRANVPITCFRCSVCATSLECLWRHTWR